VRKNTAIRRHALRMSFIPSAYGIAFSMTLMVTGVVFVESVFAIDGAGLYFLTALNNNDINGSVAIMFLGGAATCAGLWLADILVAIIDPRTRIPESA
jgi:peptide/nickel transport system permease protein